MVRMGELASSSTSGHLLTSIGLGSCIGLVLLDPARPLVALAHIMLPESNGDVDAPPAKYADLGVPALLARMAATGAVRARLQAVLVGGAQMFSFGGASGLDIGRRNEQATRTALELAGIDVCAAATGGSKGRTVRVYVANGLVTVREPGGPEVDLFAAASPVARAR